MNLLFVKLNAITGGERSILCRDDHHRLFTARLCTRRERWIIQSLVVNPAIDRNGRLWPLRRLVLALRGWKQDQHGAILGAAARCEGQKSDTPPVMSVEGASFRTGVRLPLYLFNQSGSIFRPQLFPRCCGPSVGLRTFWTVTNVWRRPDVLPKE